MAVSIPDKLALFNLFLTCLTCEGRKPERKMDWYNISCEKGLLSQRLVLHYSSGKTHLSCLLSSKQKVTQESKATSSVVLVLPDRNKPMPSSYTETHSLMFPFCDKDTLKSFFNSQQYEQAAESKQW